MEAEGGIENRLANSCLMNKEQIVFLRVLYCIPLADSWWRLTSTSIPARSSPQPQLYVPPPTTVTSSSNISSSSLPTAGGTGGGPKGGGQLPKIMRAVPAAENLLLTPPHTRPGQSWHNYWALLNTEEHAGDLKRKWKGTRFGLNFSQYSVFTPLLIMTSIKGKS